MKFILITIFVGLLSTGCSSIASTLDTNELENAKTETSVERPSEEESVPQEEKQEVQKEISKDKAVALVKEIVGSEQWGFAENIVANGKEGYLIQRTGTDADFRFFVDKQTGDVYCEKFTLIGEYRLVKSIDDVNVYLRTEFHAEKPAGESEEEQVCIPYESTEKTTEKPQNTNESQNTNEPAISAQQAKQIIETEYFGMDVAEPVRTTFNGKDTWEVKYKSVVQGEVYTRTLYVDCQTGEVYAPY